jgi:hypothetical protein
MQTSQVSRTTGAVPEPVESGTLLSSAGVAIWIGLIPLLIVVADIVIMVVKQ